MQLQSYQWTQSLHLEIGDFILLDIIRTAATQKSASGHFPSQKLISIPKDVPAAVAAGIVADLSLCEKTVAMKLIEADEKCSQDGIGLFYGQLVVLGYPEYHESNGTFKPAGSIMFH